MNCVPVYSRADPGHPVPRLRARLSGSPAGSPIPPRYRPAWTPGSVRELHPLCQANFRLVEHLGSSDVLTTCPACLTRGCTAFATKLKFKLGETCQDADHHATCGVRGVDAFAERPEHDPTLFKLADRRHHLGGVAAQAVDADHYDGVAFACVVQQGSKSRTLLSRRGPRQLVGVDALRINTRRRERIDLVVEGLVPGADTRVPELGSSDRCGARCLQA